MFLIESSGCLSGAFQVIDLHVGQNIVNHLFGHNGDNPADHRDDGLEIRTPANEGITIIATELELAQILFHRGSRQNTVHI